MKQKKIEKYIVGIFAAVCCMALGVSEVSAGSATLTWNANGEPDLAGYKIYYDTASHVGNCPAGFGGNVVNVGNVTTYAFNNLTAGQTYYFQVAAYDTSNNQSACSSQVSKTIPAADVTAPVTTATPAGGTYTSAQTVTLNANESATIYYTMDGSVPTASSTVYAYPLSVSSSATVKYFAKDTAGNSEAVKTQIYTLNIAVTDASAPSIPTNFVATAVSASQINLNWTVSLDNVGVAGYEIYRNGEYKAKTAYAQYSDMDLTPSSVYAYKVRAYDATGNTSAFTGDKAATTHTAPVAPVSGGGGGGSYSTPTVTIGGGNGGGGGGSYGTPSPAPAITTGTPVTAQSSATTVVSQTVATSQPAVYVNPFAAIGSYITKRHLAVGTRGEDVKRLQEFLKIEGHLAEIPTGYFGKATLAAVRKFQEEHNIAKSGQEGYGEVGIRTRTEINRHLTSASTAMPSGATTAQDPAVIAMLQEQILALQKQLLILLEELDRRRAAEAGN